MFQTEKTEHLQAYQELGGVIREIISAKGVDIVNHTQEFSAALSEKKVEPVLVMQLALLLEAGNIRNYLTQIKTGISMIDVNNMITCAQAETGLTKQKLRLLLTAVLYGLSLPTSIESVVIPGGMEGKVQDAGILPPEAYADKLSSIEVAVRFAEKYEDGAKLAKVAQDLERLAGAGVADAQYYKGLCYLRGWGTEVDLQEAQRWLDMAATAGHIEANAALGDYYFENDTLSLTNYTTAFHYYTQIGAVALSKPRTENLQVILASKQQHLLQLILSGVLLVLIYIFNTLMGSGAFGAEEASHWVGAILSDVLNTGVFGLNAYLFFRSKYNKVKWAPVAMFIITALFAFFTLI